MPKTKSNAVDQNVVARVPIRYDGFDFDVGESFSVREADLAQLLSVDAVVVVLDAESLDATQQDPSAVDLEPKQTTADATTTDGDKLPPEDKKAAK